MNALACILDNIRYKRTDNS